VIVIEAIKLIESGLRQICQALWVTTCSPEQQIRRLMNERSLALEDAELRVAAQPPQAEKISLADVVIDTSGDIGQTQQQVEAAWQAINKGENHGHVRIVSSPPSQAIGCGTHR
jgi:dephospho-CoA kinase